MVNANVVWIDGEAYSTNHPTVLARYAKLKKEIENDAQSLGGLRNQVSQPDPLPALERSKKAHRRSKGSVLICIKIISIRKRASDLDNIIYGAKGIRDALAKAIGVDDNDPRVRWEYDTVTTTGVTGTQVLISRL